MAPFQYIFPASSLPHSFRRIAYENPKCIVSPFIVMIIPRKRLDGKASLSAHVQQTEAIDVILKEELRQTLSFGKGILPRQG